MPLNNTDVSTMLLVDLGGFAPPSRILFTLLHTTIIFCISLELLQLYEHLFVDQPFLANDIQLEEPEQLSVVVVQ